MEPFTTAGTTSSASPSPISLAYTWSARNTLALSSFFREALARYAETLPAGHQTIAIGRVRLARSLLLQKRYAEAEAESNAGYEILMKQASPSVSWLQSTRKDLAEEYDALHRPDEAAKFRAELARTNDAAGKK